MEEEFDIEEKLKKDIAYIENETITKYLNLDKKAKKDEQIKYVKFSKPLNAVSISSLTRKQYEQYWKSQYTNYPKEWKEVLEAINEKFENGLTPLDKMVILILKSNDREEEKVSVIKALLG